jgi:hypothetical protein
MRLRLLGRNHNHDFVVIDSMFPQKEPFAFRNAEINQYFKRVKNFASYTMHPLLPDTDAWFTHGYGIDYVTYKENKKGYLRYYRQNKNRIHYLRKDRPYSFKLAYSYFLGETYVLLPFYEKYKIPFMFVLYPGGCFGLNNEGSDRILKKIFNSEHFRGVIVTQQITKDYLLAKKLCPENQIKYIYGGFVQFKKDDLKQKRYYKKDKNTFDVCFVAAKYTEKGIDKGYDLFIEAAKKLCQNNKAKDIRFHVVGGFDENDIDVAEIRGRITFYGYKQPDFLADFYAGMDIFLAPNRPFKIFDGNFDGFPLGIDAGYCGTALFVADELKMNHHYVEEKEIIIVPLDAEKIADLVVRHYNDLETFYELSRRGQTVTQKLFDIDYQIQERLKLFEKFVSLDIAHEK